MIGVFVIGLWTVVFAIILNAKNVQSQLLFKVIPGFSGVYLMVFSGTKIDFIVNLFM